jgi:hypothetical protein
MRPTSTLLPRVMWWEKVYIGRSGKLMQDGI